MELAQGGLHHLRPVLAGDADGQTTGALHCKVRWGLAELWLPRGGLQNFEGQS
jgi:hypothetical protein